MGWAGANQGEYLGPWLWWRWRLIRRPLPFSKTVPVEAATAVAFVAVASVLPVPVSVDLPKIAFFAIARNVSERCHYCRSIEHSSKQPFQQFQISILALLEVAAGYSLSTTSFFVRTGTPCNQRNPKVHDGYDSGGRAGGDLVQESVEKSQMFLPSVVGSRTQPNSIYSHLVMA